MIKEAAMKRSMEWIFALAVLMIVVACGATWPMQTSRLAPLGISTVEVDVWTAPRIAALERLAARARGMGNAGPLAGIAEEKANKVTFTSATDVDFGPFVGAVETDVECESRTAQICGYFSLGTSGPVMRWRGAGWRFCGGACDDGTSFAWVAVSGQ
jgi:hypothetical protein